MVRFVNGEHHKGIIKYLSKVGVSKTRTFRIEVAIPNTGDKISEGLTTELHIPTAQVRAHLISPAVLTLSKDGVLGVKSVKDDKTVAFHSVKIISDTADGVWVSGLPEEVTLITVGQEYVRAGQYVRSVSEGTLKEKPKTNSSPIAGAKP